MYAIIIIIIIIIKNATKKVTARPRMIDTWMDGSRMINEGFLWHNLAEALHTYLSFALWLLLPS